MTTPTPPNNSGDKTRKQLITILVLLVLIILAMVVFLVAKISGDRGGDSAVAEANGSSSSENGAAQGQEKSPAQVQAEKATTGRVNVTARHPGPGAGGEGRRCVQAGAGEPGAAADLCR